MKYTYSKSTPSPDYRVQSPSRVSPVGSSSFRGGNGGGGLAGLIPLLSSLWDGGEPTYEEAAEYASDLAPEMEAERAAEMAGEAADYDSMAQRAKEWVKRQKEKLVSETGTANGAVMETPRQTAIEAVEKLRSQSNLFADELAKRNAANAANAANARPNSTELKSHSELYVPSGQTASQVASGQRASGSGSARGGEGAGQRVDQVLTPTTGYDELRYRSFADVDLPTKSVAVKGGRNEVAEPYIKEDSIPAGKPLNTTGQMSFANVQDLPVPDTSQYQQNLQARQQSFFGNAAQFGREFLQYAGNYQLDKMEHPLREIGVQTAASLLAAPALGAVGVSAVPAAATASVAQAVQKVIPQVSTAVQQAVTPSTTSNIISFTDYAKKAATAAAAAGAVSQALPAAAQTSGWNASTQNYTVQSGQNLNVGKISGSVNKPSGTIGAIKGRI